MFTVYKKKKKDEWKKHSLSFLFPTGSLFHSCHRRKDRPAVLHAPISGFDLVAPTRVMVFWWLPEAQGRHLVLLWLHLAPWLV